jgi:hypothetical protein
MWRGGESWRVYGAANGEEKSPPVIQCINIT